MAGTPGSPAPPEDMFGLSNRFHVIVDGVDLGRWAACQGLRVDFNPEPVLSGGDDEFVHLLPGQVKYNNVTLTRAMNAKDSATVLSWLKDKSGELSSAAGSVDYMDGSAQIILYDAVGEKVISWDLRGVHPFSWSGPSLDARTAKVAEETLVLAHTGFL